MTKPQRPRAEPIPHKDQRQQEVTLCSSQEPLFTESQRRMLRHYNSLTGKCDLSQEEALTRDACDRAEAEASERRRQERLERWRNTPLDPDAKEALGGMSPEGAWSQLRWLVQGAIEEHHEEAHKLAREMGMGPQLELDMDFEDLTVLLSKTNPRTGINEFIRMNPDIPLHNPNLEKVITPLQALKGVLQVLLFSERGGL